MTRHGFNPGRLRAEMIKRGVDSQTLAGLAGVCPATMSHVVNGYSANPRTLTRIVTALVELPLVAGMGDLLEEVSGPRSRRLRGVLGEDPHQRGVRVAEGEVLVHGVDHRQRPVPHDLGNEDGIHATPQAIGDE